MIFTLSQVLEIKSGLNEFYSFCSNKSYTPNKQDVTEIVKFILLNSGASTSGLMLEHDKFIDYLIKDSDFLIMESDLISDLGEIGSVAGGAAKVAGGALGVAALGIIGGAGVLGGYVTFLFKKGKLNASVKKEQSLKQKKIDEFFNLVKMKEKIK